MNTTLKVILCIILIVPVAAYLDAIVFRGATFREYIYICVWEMVIFTLGMLTGIKLIQKELKITS